MDRTIAVVGAGTTGSHMLDLLAGEPCDLVIIDRDVVAARNCDASAFYTREMVADGAPKTVAAERVLTGQHGGAVEGCVADVAARTVHDLLEGVDVVLEGTDTVETRRLLNEWAMETGTPWIHTGALGRQGAVLPVVPGETPCFDCVFGAVDGRELATCSSAGIDRETARAVAAEAVDLAGAVLDGAVPTGLRRVTGTRVRRTAVTPREGCDACAGETPHLDGERGTRATAVCGPDTYQVRPDHEQEIDPYGIVEKQEFDGEVTVNDHLVRVEGADRFTVFRDGRMIVETGSAAQARAVYARVVGN